MKNKFEHLLLATLLGIAVLLGLSFWLDLIFGFNLFFKEQKKDHGTGRRISRILGNSFVIQRDL